MIKVNACIVIMPLKTWNLKTWKFDKNFSNFPFQILGPTLHTGEVHEGQDQFEAGREENETSPGADQAAKCQQGSLYQAQGSGDDQEKGQSCKLGNSYFYIFSKQLKLQLIKGFLSK